MPGSVQLTDFVLGITDKTSHFINYKNKMRRFSTCCLLIVYPGHEFIGERLLDRSVGELIEPHLFRKLLNDPC